MDREQEASREEAQEDGLYVPLTFSASQLVGQTHGQWGGVGHQQP